MASLLDLCLLFAMLSVSFLAEGRIGFVSKEEDMDLERQLKVLNKSPIKSFKDEDGSVIDCININKQPAFDHPLLRNHTIQCHKQLQPTSRPKGMLAAKSEYKGVECPQRTVPIKRTTKEDLIRAKSLPRLLPSTAHSSVSNDKGPYYLASARTTKNQSIQYTGLGGSITIYNETVTPSQYSGAGIWLANDHKGQVDAIHYGWIVYPALYKDHKTRTIGFWTANNGQAGCFNILCPGFVQVNSKHHLGEEILNQSTYGGVQYFQPIYLYRDEVTGNWWVEQETFDGEGPVHIGYWPKSLFGSLAEFATVLQYGGSVYSTKNVPLPTMGSGHFEPPDFRKTSSVSHVQASYKKPPPHHPVMHTFANHPCYQVELIGGFDVLFGGPGGKSCGN